MSVEGSLTTSDCRRIDPTEASAEDFVDIFEFTLQSETFVRIDLRSADFDTHFLFLDDSQSELDRNEAQKGVILFSGRRLGPSAYRILVGAQSTSSPDSSGSYGEYTLSLVEPNCARVPISNWGITVQGNLALTDCIRPDLGTMVDHVDYYVDLYDFTLDTDSFVEIDLKSSDFDTYLRLYNTSSSLYDGPSNEVARNDDGGSFRNSHIGLSLSAGTYRIHVATFDGHPDSSASYGEYSLSATTDSGVGDCDPAALTRIPVGSTMIGQLTTTDCSTTDLAVDAGRDYGHVDIYEFTLDTEAAVQIDLKSSDLDSILHLYQQSLTEVVRDDGRGPISDSQIRQALPADTYLLYVGTWTYPTNQGIYGNYSLSVIEVDSDIIGSESAESELVCIYGVHYGPFLIDDDPDYAHCHRLEDDILTVNLADCHSVAPIPLSFPGIDIGRLSQLRGRCVYDGQTGIVFEITLAADDIVSIELVADYYTGSGVDKLLILDAPQGGGLTDQFEFERGDSMRLGADRIVSRMREGTYRLVVLLERSSLGDSDSNYFLTVKPADLPDDWCPVEDIANYSPGREYAGTLTADDCYRPDRQYGGYAEGIVDLLEFTLESDTDVAFNMNHLEFEALLSLYDEDGGIVARARMPSFEWDDLGEPFFNHDGLGAPSWPWNIEQFNVDALAAGTYVLHVRSAKPVDGDEGYGSYSYSPYFRETDGGCPIDSNRFFRSGTFQDNTCISAQHPGLDDYRLVTTSDAFVEMKLEVELDSLSYEGISLHVYDRYGEPQYGRNYGVAVLVDSDRPTATLSVELPAGSYQVLVWPYGFGDDAEYRLEVQVDKHRVRHSVYRSGAVPSADVWQQHRQDGAEQSNLVIGCSGKGAAVRVRGVVFGELIGNRIDVVWVVDEGAEQFETWNVSRSSEPPWASPDSAAETIAAWRSGTSLSLTLLTDTPHTQQFNLAGLFSTVAQDEIDQCLAMELPETRLPAGSVLQKTESNTLYRSGKQFGSGFDSTTIRLQAPSDDAPDWAGYSTLFTLTCAVAGRTAVIGGGRSG